ncbi:hypothetical protein H2199_007100 [Coniosporium tulheliwenetii]|uniref:Uncharacterized protein n=1 Tax=Coniosporium tulheliwenetii TaxID=3383036 RepID=A0ACC2YSQ3_9PEZI|nr:hypothetical protein H2199_007100 [Cladosporium sp. JES 115]
MSFQPVIRKKVNLVCGQLSRCMDRSEVLDLVNVWSAFAGDVITEYAFGFCYNHLESPGCKENFHAAFMAVSEFGHVALQFPWIHPVLNMLPDSINERMNPPLSIILKLQRVRQFIERVESTQLITSLKDLRTIILRIASEKGQAYKQQSHPTIFHEVLRSDLPPQEKALRRLGDEAQTIIGAGLETTAWALSTACFHIINQPRVYEKLRDELCKAIPDPSAPADWLQLENLPYLKACIREGIRLSYGVSARNPRLHNKPTIYKDWVIPARTPVSMTIIDVHHDEEFLAYAELGLALATVFRRFSFDLYETDITDVELAHDFFLPSQKLDSKGVRVKVKPFDN